MTNHTNIEPTQNTAKRHCSLARQPNTNGVGNSGQRQPGVIGHGLMAGNIAR